MVTERQVLLICGPPGSGKTTLAHSLGLKVYDRDDKCWRNEPHFVSAISHLGSDLDAQAAVIRCGAGAQSRSKTANLIKPTEVRILEVDAETCIRRVRERSRGNVDRDIAAVRKWWRDYTSRPSVGLDPRETKRWRKLRDQVVREQPICKLQLPGCTQLSTTADHILTVKARPDLAFEPWNHQGSCASCNMRRGAKTMEQIRPKESAKALDFFG